MFQDLKPSSELLDYHRALNDTPESVEFQRVGKPLSHLRAGCLKEWRVTLVGCAQPLRWRWAPGLTWGSALLVDTWYSQVTFDACDAQGGGSPISSVARGSGLPGPQLRRWRPTSYLPTWHCDLKDCVFIQGEQGGCRRKCYPLRLWLPRNSWRHRVLSSCPHLSVENLSQTTVSVHHCLRCIPDSSLGPERWQPLICSVAFDHPWHSWPLNTFAQIRRWSFAWVWRCGQSKAWLCQWSGAGLKVRLAPSGHLG